jgi:hypothetical protein
MLVVKIELHSAVTRRITKIAEWTISNIGTSEGSIFGEFDERCNYEVREQELKGDKVTTVNKVYVLNYARNRLAVGNLLALALHALGYGAFDGASTSKELPK